MKQFFYVARDTELMLDLDWHGGKSPRYDPRFPFAKTFAKLLDTAVVGAPHIEESRTKGNFHVYIKLSKPLSAPYRIALQAMFGSDPNREALALADYHHGHRGPVLLISDHRWRGVRAPDHVCSCTHSNRGRDLCPHLKPYRPAFRRNK